MKDHRLANNAKCPGCGKLLDASLNSNGDEAPEEGDPMVCIDCSTIGVFTTVLGFIAIRRPTPDEEREFLADPEVQRILASLRVLRERGM